MGRILASLLVVGLVALVAAPAAWADDHVEAIVDTYVEGATAAGVMGGPGSAGYDDGFWISGGGFSLKINVTLQARFEAWMWGDKDEAADGAATNDIMEAYGGDLSGFSLPRATLKFSGEAPCNFAYYVELEFGHFGRDVTDARYDYYHDDHNLGPGTSTAEQSMNFDNTREAWIEWRKCPALNIRMGQVMLPTTRQAMVAPELQQFVDVSLATAYVVRKGIGRTDRNRDHGLLIHGVFGCRGEWAYVLSITNGDGGDSIRNVLDPRTSDNLAYGARINWAFLAPIGYTEGGLGFVGCDWYGEVGLWGIYYADRADQSHHDHYDHLEAGIDVALGYRGFSFTGAFNYRDMSSEFEDDDDVEVSYLAQIGYHFANTPWEIAARYTGYTEDLEDDDDDEDEWAYEIAVALNYYINGHANKLTLDVAFVETGPDDDLFNTVYPGYQDGYSEMTATLIRFQWQLAL